MLKLTNPQLKDSGEYECQVSYHDDKEEKLRMPYRLIVLGKLKEFYIPFADVIRNTNIDLFYTKKFNSRYLRIMRNIVVFNG